MLTCWPTKDYLDEDLAWAGFALAQRITRSLRYRSGYFGPGTASECGRKGPQNGTSPTGPAADTPRAAWISSSRASNSSNVSTVTPTIALRSSSSDLRRARSSGVRPATTMHWIPKSWMSGRSLSSLAAAARAAALPAGRGPGPSCRSARLRQHIRRRRDTGRGEQIGRRLLDLNNRRGCRSRRTRKGSPRHLAAAATQGACRRHRPAPARPWRGRRTRG